MNVNEYKEEKLIIGKDVLFECIMHLEYLIDQTLETLAIHDHSLGRTTTKNKRIAESLELTIASTEATLAQLKREVHTERKEYFEK